MLGVIPLCVLCCLTIGGTGGKGTIVLSVSVNYRLKILLEKYTDKVSKDERSEDEGKPKAVARSLRDQREIIIEKL